jgi:hypothetical protein
MKIYNIVFLSVYTCKEYQKFLVNLNKISVAKKSSDVEKNRRDILQYLKQETRSYIAEDYSKIFENFGFQ